METIVCKICNEEFEFTDGEIEFYTNRNLDKPKRCPDCRAKKRRESGNEISQLRQRVEALEKNKE